MTTIPTPYEDLLREVFETGVEKTDRTGTGTKALVVRTMRFNLAEFFPLIGTKDVFVKGVIAELLWLLSGDTNSRTLEDQGVNIWREWADPETGSLGRVYGAQWRSWKDYDGGTIDQISSVVESIRNNPDSRRHIVNAWNVAEINDMALPPCHTLFQFFVTEGKLSCHLYQRSGDMFLGIPFNIASYSLLTHMIAQQTGLEVGEFIHTIGDCHIYSNHYDQVAEQLSRVDEAPEYPQLVIKRKPASIFDYKLDDFEFVGYKPMGKIKAPVAV